MAGFCQPAGALLDIDRLLALSELAAMPIGEWGEQLAADAGEGLTLALADDEAFNFITPITGAAGALRREDGAL